MLPSVDIDGMRAVPVRIERLDATVVLDCARRTATADATMTYVTGREHGHPLLDLRLPIEACHLDGRPLSPTRIAAHDVGEGADSTVRVLDTAQSPGTVHTLRMRYRLRAARTALPGTHPPILEWCPGPGVRWGLGMSDLVAGRYLEAWFPATLPFDHFDFRLDLRITGTRMHHTFLTNAVAVRAGPGRWVARFPPRTTSMSPMLELRPTEDVVVRARRFRSPTLGRATEVRVAAAPAAGIDLDEQLPRLIALLTHSESEFGPLPDPRYLAVFHNGSGGMEYDQACTTSTTALAHEVLHAWFGRGLAPTTSSDAWWDEGFVTFRCEGAVPVPFDFELQPVCLCTRRPFQRTTPTAAYTAGAVFFHGLAALLGPHELTRTMRNLYRTGRGESMSTEQLEAALIAASGHPAVVDAFHRFVYGFPDPREPIRLRVRSVAPGHTRLTADIVNEGNVRCDHAVVVFTSGNRRAAACGFDLAPGTSTRISVAVPPGFGTPAGTRCEIHTRTGSLAGNHTTAATVGPVG